MGRIRRLRSFRFESAEGEVDAASAEQYAEEEPDEQSAGSRVELGDADVVGQRDPDGRGDVLGDRQPGRSGIDLDPQ